ncbi:unnamed protein product [Brassica rapa]|uniref:Uncharacterized protein n=1 Tax=Brassica campestris TaxID=3711 RepID=A0A8D9M4V1_BRACM|nr:unnamed protein product [Brassica rapa]
MDRGRDKQIRNNMRDTNMRFESLYKCSSSSTSPPPPPRKQRERERDSEKRAECLSAPIGTKTLSFSRPFSAFSPLPRVSQLFSRCNLIQSRAEIELFRVGR